MAMNLPKDKGEKDKMAISYIEHIGATAHGHIKTVDRRKSDNLMISRWRSSPAGIDWQMLRSMRENVRHSVPSQKD